MRHRWQAVLEARFLEVKRILGGGFSAAHVVGMGTLLVVVASGAVSVSCDERAEPSFVATASPGGQSAAGGMTTVEPPEPAAVEPPEPVAVEPPEPAAVAAASPGGQSAGGVPERVRAGADTSIVGPDRSTVPTWLTVLLGTGAVFLLINLGLSIAILVVFSTSGLGAMSARLYEIGMRVGTGYGSEPRPTRQARSETAAPTQPNEPSGSGPPVQERRDPPRLIDRSGPGVGPFQGRGRPDPSDSERNPRDSSRF